MSTPIDELQREKLQLEIADLKKPWWKRKDYLQFIIPAVLTAGALGYAIVSGFFSTKYDQYQLQKAKLELEIQYFKQEKENIISSNKKISIINDSLKRISGSQQDSLILLQRRIVSAHLELRRMNSNISILVTEKRRYDEQMAHLNKEYNRATQGMQNRLTKTYVSESKLQNQLSEEKAKADGLNEELKFHKFMEQSMKNNPYIQRGRMEEFASWNRERAIEYHTARGEKLKIEGERLSKSLKKLHEHTDSLHAVYKSLEISLPDPDSLK